MTDPPPRPPPVLATPGSQVATLHTLPARRQCRGASEKGKRKPELPHGPAGKAVYIFTEEEATPTGETEGAWAPQPRTNSPSKNWRVLVVNAGPRALPRRSRLTMRGVGPRDSIFNKHTPRRFL